MRKFVWIALAFLVLAGLAGRLIYTKQRARATTNAAAVEKDIREHLPLGTSRSEVEAYLDQKGLGHSYIDESTEFPDYRHTEMAMVRETSRTWLVRGDLQILFKFDSQERLIDFKFQEIFTGP